MSKIKIKKYYYCLKCFYEIPNMDGFPYTKKSCPRCGSELSTKLKLWSTESSWMRKWKHTLGSAPLARRSVELPAFQRGKWAILVLGVA